MLGMVRPRGRQANAGEQAGDCGRAGCPQFLVKMAAGAYPECANSYENVSESLIIALQRDCTSSQSHPPARTRRS